MTTTVVHVDSRFRIPGASDTDFPTELRESVNLDSALMRVDNVSFINSLWTVDGVNQKLFF